VSRTRFKQIGGGAGRKVKLAKKKEKRAEERARGNVRRRVLHLDQTGKETDFDHVGE